MAVTRREFLKIAGLLGAAAAAGTIGNYSGRSAVSQMFKGTRKHKTVCPFCSLGCSLIIHTKKGIPVYVEGDNDDPICRGSVCSKAHAILPLYNENKNMSDVLYRKPFSTGWEGISWDKALSLISEKIKKTRDDSFMQFEGSLTVNRTEGISVYAGSSLTNEEAYLVNKFSRILGIPYISTENIDRNDNSQEILKSYYGLAGCTNPWPDISNANSILIIGSNPSRNYAVAMKHILSARAKGAKIICVDPVLSETAAHSDIYCRIKPGSDSVFMLGLLYNAFQNYRINKEYLTEYTDATYLLNQESNAEIAGGIRSAALKLKAGYERDGRGNPKKDDEMHNTRTVFQTLKDLLSPYTPNYVSERTGCPTDIFLAAAESFTSTYEKSKSGSIVFGSNISCSEGGRAVRLLSMLQMILGNTGLSGGGIYSCSSGANTTGVYYQISSPSMLPGNIPLPSATATSSDEDFNRYIKNNVPVSNDPMSINVKQDLKKHITCLLKAWYGETATASTKFDFDWLPKVKKAKRMKWIDSLKGSAIKGALLFGADHNLSGISPASAVQSMPQLDWVVATGNPGKLSDFWKDSPSRIKTEVFFIPSQPLLLKEGSVTTSDRTTLWKEGLQNVFNNVKSELSIIHEIFIQTRKAYESGGVLPEPIKYAQWNKNSNNPEIILKEMSGTNIIKRKQIKGMQDLTDDGTVQCGNIFYCGIYDAGNRALSDSPKKIKNNVGIYNSWGWSIPGNVRILYNRAGVDRNGSPWNNEKNAVSLDGGAKSADVIHGEGSSKEKNPFIMNRDGVGYLFVEEGDDSGFPLSRNSGSADKRDSINGMIGIITGTDSSFFIENESLFKESSLAGFCEIPENIAKDRRISNGDMIKISYSGRSSSFRALVTNKTKWNITLRGAGADILLGAYNNGRHIYPIDLSIIKKNSAAGSGV